jgi:hypothetical protein
MNADFVRLAHRKAIWAELQRLLLDKYVASDGPPKEEIVCEEVPYAQKDVTNEAVLEVLEIIQQHELDENLEMRNYEFKKRERINAKREQEQSDSDPDADGPAIFGGFDGPAINGPLRAGNPPVAKPSGGQSSQPPVREEEEGAAAADGERQSPHPSASEPDRKRSASAGGNR